jgi:hypothetical protein
MGYGANEKSVFAVFHDTEKTLRKHWEWWWILVVDIQNSS